MAYYRQIEVDFGPMPVEQKDFIIIDAAVTPTSVISGDVAYSAPTGKELDEVEMDELSLRFGAGAGQFTISASGLSGPVADNFKINYTVQAIY